MTLCLFDRRKRTGEEAAGRKRTVSLNRFCPVAFQVKAGNIRQKEEKM